MATKPRAWRVAQLERLVGAVDYQPPPDPAQFERVEKLERWFKDAEEVLTGRAAAFVAETWQRGIDAFRAGETMPAALGDLFHLSYRGIDPSNDVVLQIAAEHGHEPP